MTLDVTPLSQRDNKWRYQRLGTVDGTTIGSHGCVITSASMMCTWHGKVTTPDKFDDFLTDNGLYYNGNLFVDSSIQRWFSQIKHIKTVLCDNLPAPINEIISYINNANPVFVWVMNEGVRHCVLAVGYEGNQIIVNDPWRGDKVRVDQRWGDSATVILQVSFFMGPREPGGVTNSPGTGTPAPVPKTMTDEDKKAIEQWRKLQSDPHSKGVWYEAQNVINTITDLEGQVETANRSSAGYQSRATDLQNKLNDTAVALEKASQEVSNREEQVSRLKAEMTDKEKAYKEQIDALNKSIPNVTLINKQWQTRYDELDAKYKDEARQKGQALNDLAEAKKQLENCQKGQPKSDCFAIFVENIKRLFIRS